MNIWKYEIPIKDNFTLEIPKDSKILSFQVQDDSPKIWALVEEELEKETREFKLLGTGLSFKKEELNDYKFVGTIVMYNGSFVLHLFIKETLHDVIAKTISSQFLG
jgi:hypothetical protein